MSDDAELTPEEKMAFDTLPREASPSEFLEERIVGALRAGGTLRNAPAERLPAGHRRGEAAGRWFRPWAVAAASIAASLVLFGSGAVMGHWMGARSTERVLLAVRQQDNAQLAQRIQEAGSAYVGALAALGELRATGGRGTGSVKAVPAAEVASEVLQGREAALGALYGAALELDRMTPGDPDISRILDILEQLRSQPAGVSGAKRTVWY